MAHAPRVPRTVSVISLGCSKNRVDSEQLLGALAAAGYQVVSAPEEADVVFVNTCGFIEDAKRESIETILEAAEYKKSGRLQALFVTGCLSQRYGMDIVEGFPEVDGFMGVSDYARAPEWIEAFLRGERTVHIGSKDEGERFPRCGRVLTTPAYSAYVKISDGCDNRCAYCAIPLIRGSYRSRPYSEIVEECRSLVQRGVTEITLIAQDTSRYGNDFPEKTLLLPALMREIAQIPALHWLRVLYCYPDTVTDELLDEIANNPKICSYLDLPLQHIDGALLKAMNRRGSPELICRLIERCRARGITVRTTMIVGFPGETDEAFDRLMAFIDEARFDRLGAFAFSPEDGTLAADMAHPVPEATRAERRDRLMARQQEIARALSHERIGSTCEALIEGREGEYYVARSMQEAPEVDGNLYLTSARPLQAGEYVTAHITDADEYDLYGEVIA